MLVDTDVLIWYLKGDESARAELDALPNFYLSVVSYIELVQGMRNKHELHCLRKAFRRWQAKIICLSEDVSAKAMFYVEQHYLSHSLQLADALIAATANANGFELLTANVKHYRVINDISLKKFKPSR